MSGLRDRVCRLLKTERVDMVDLRHASPTLQFDIIRSARVLYRKDVNAENRYEQAVLRAYLDGTVLRRKQQQILKQRTEAWFSRDR